MNDQDDKLAQQIANDWSLEYLEKRQKDLRGAITTQRRFLQVIENAIAKKKEDEY